MTITKAEDSTKDTLIPPEESPEQYAGGLVPSIIKALKSVIPDVENLLKGKYQVKPPKGPVEPPKGPVAAPSPDRLPGVAPAEKTAPSRDPDAPSTILDLEDQEMLDAWAMRGEMDFDQMAERIEPTLQRARGYRSREESMAHPAYTPKQVGEVDISKPIDPNIPKQSAGLIKGIDGAIRRTQELAEVLLDMDVRVGVGGERVLNEAYKTAEKEYLDSLQKVMFFYLPRLTSHGAELGRNLDQLKGDAEHISLFRNGIENLAKKMESYKYAPERTKSDVVRGMAQKMLQLKDVDQWKTYAKQQVDPAWGDWWYGMWVNSLLSSPLTHEANFYSNLFVAMYAPAERAVASGFGALRSVFGSQEDRVLMGESLAMMNGYISAMFDAIVLAGNVLRGGDSFITAGGVKAEMRKGQKSMPLPSELKPGLGILGNLLDGLTYLGSAPGKLLQTSDEFWKAIAYRAELHALAWRKAYQHTSGKKAKEAYLAILQNPPAELREQAKEFATIQTFTREFQSGLGKKFMAMRNTPGWAGGLIRILLPFVQTPGNIFNYGLGRTPIAFHKVYKSIAKAEGPERDKLLAEYALGTGLFMYYVNASRQGLITGNAPATTDRKHYNTWNLGHTKHSVKVFDKSVSYARFEPIASVLDMAAEVGRLMDAVAMAPEHTEKLNEILVGVGSMMTGLVKDKHFVRGAIEMAGVFTNPHMASRLFNRWVSSSVPGSSFWRYTNFKADPHLKRIDNMVDALWQALPFGHNKLIHRRGPFGRKIDLAKPITNIPGTDVFVMKDLKNNRVVDTFVGLGIGITQIPLKWQGVKLEKDTYEWLAEHQGKAMSVALNKVIASSDFWSMTNDDKVEYLRRTMSDIAADHRSYLEDGYKGLEKVPISKEFSKKVSKLKQKKSKNKAGVSGYVQKRSEELPAEKRKQYTRPPHLMGPR
ncbi:hypothetical protein [uncultured Mediterranean phage uvDeep-CGR2-AD3-C191]|nr:hypothetical protein [uncultured Mediterranean phage uvDeep-CGR2-AD3-C191]